jgi:hypothetical protein
LLFMDPEFIKWIVGQAGTAGLAALAMWMLRQTYEDRIRAEKAHQEDKERLHNDVRQVMKDNTQAFIDLQRILNILCVAIEEEHEDNGRLPRRSHRTRTGAKQNII